MIGIILIQNQKNLKSISVNLAFWLEMYIGGSLLFTFYLVESFARKRVSDEFILSQWGSIGYFVPRTIYLGHDIWFTRFTIVYLTLFYDR